MQGIPKKKENYLRFDLSFTIKELELEYENSKRVYNRLFLNVVILFGFLIALFGWLVNPFHNQDQFRGKTLYSVIALTVVSVLLFFIGRKFIRFSKIILAALILIYFFGLMELISQDRTDWSNLIYFIKGRNLEFLSLSVVLARISWKLTTILLFIMNMFCAFRYSNFNSNYDMNFYPLIHFLQNTFLLSLTAYFIEKFDRENFYKISNYEYSLACFKDLITKAFPSAVIIMKDEKILFRNQKTLSLLECDEDKEILKKLDKIKLDDQNNTIYFNNTENLMTEERKPINENEKFLNLVDSTKVCPRGATQRRNTQRFYCGIFRIEDKEKSLEISLTKIVWEHEVASMIIVTENKIIEKMRTINEQSEYKDRLLATVSHDLRTPLSGIMGMIRMTLEIIGDLITKKYMNVALRSSQLLLMMINDILDYSQISNGKLRLNFERFSLWDVIKDVAKLFKFQAKMKEIEFIKENLAGKREETIIKSDQNRIKQVLFNLLGNALKFTVKGSIKITLARLGHEGIAPNSPREDFPVYLKAFKISVKDTGIGIKKEDQGNLFKLFGKLQNENTQSLNKSGVGLGLAISQSLVKILNNDRENGRITVESEFNKGSCFSFVIYSGEKDESKDDLVYRSMEEKSAAEMTEKFNILERELEKEWNTCSLQKPNRIIKRKKHLLVVDDDQINILVTSTYLKAYDDIIFDVAFNGEEALNKIKLRAAETFYYDLILMDCNMPKLNGFEAAKIITGMIEAEEIPPLVMIACTANGSPKDYEVCFENGMRDNLTKPFSKEEMRRKIEKYS